MLAESPGYTPFRFREVGDQLLITNEAGDYGFFAPDIGERFFEGALTNDEARRFRDLSILIDSENSWRVASLMRRLKDGQRPTGNLSYLILVPTLRCDLSCTYCQVSRAPLNAKGFDWGDEELQAYERFIEVYAGDHIKVEFQGGEPTLRPDLLQSIIAITKRYCPHAEFVVCTNLARISRDTEELFDRDDLVISTSIDGPKAVMTANRTQDEEATAIVLQNFHYILEKYGPEKVAALPTITETGIEQPEAVIDTYRALGFESIFLRPVNYMGFARKQHGQVSHGFEVWEGFYKKALEYIVSINKTAYFDEFYLRMMVQTIFADMKHGFVDFRSPAGFLRDYGVIDFDGTIYPTDEARMLSRIGHVNLAVGTISGGIDNETLAELNFNAVHQVNPDCLHCAYMPFCGVDIVDDMSRYRRIDVPKHETWFCNRQTMLFDMIFSKVGEQNRRWLDMFVKWTFGKRSDLRGYELFGV